jgi:hypothetical protein
MHQECMNGWIHVHCPKHAFMLHCSNHEKCSQHEYEINNANTRCVVKFHIPVPVLAEVLGLQEGRHMQQQDLAPQWTSPLVCGVMSMTAATLSQ